MDKKIKGIVFLVFFTTVVDCFTVESSSFVLPKKQKNKKLSKNELKECIGESAKEAFVAAVDVSQALGVLQIEMAGMEEFVMKKTCNFSVGDVCPVTSQLFCDIGKIQIEVTGLQKRFSKIVERLVDNQKPFKKASRDELETAQKELESVASCLHQQVDYYQLLKAKLVKISGDNVKDRVTLLSQAQQKFKTSIDDVKRLQDHMSETNCLNVV